MSRIRTFTLECGMPLLVESMPGVRSLGLTWLVPAGSARDPEARQGASAIWAEMLMRGAGELDSRAQADMFDRLGAARGAGVETFYLGLSGTLLGARLGEVLPLVADMVRRPRFDESALGPARDLCLQAIDAQKDDPQERLMVLLRARHAPPPINRSPLGTREGIERVTASEVKSLWHERARPVGSILALAGEVNADDAARRLDGLLRGWSGVAPAVSWGRPTTRGYHHEREDANQTHIAVAYDAPPEPDAGAWPERLAVAALSDGMSGRLFSEVREKRGLCYSVHASYAADAKYGRVVAYSGTTPPRAQETLDVLLSELKRITTAAGRMTEDEFRRAAIGLKSRLVMSGESTSGRAAALARDWHKLGRARSLEELAGEIDALTLPRINEHLERRSLGEFTVATLGPEALTLPVV